MLPIILLVLFGVIQFGILFNNYVTLTDAVRAGARKAAVGRHLPDPAGSAEAAVRSSASDLKPADLQVTVSSSFAQGSDATVAASYPYSISLLGLVVASGRLSSSSTERVE